MSKKNKINNKSDWAIFALGYLNLSKLACLEIINNKYNGLSDDLDDFSVASIYIPILFNIKHGIEILLKNFSINFLKKENIDQSDYSHDIEEIFLNFKSKIGKKRLKEINDFYKTEFPDDKDDFELTLVRLKEIVNKYQNLDFFKEKIGKDYIIRDFDNTVFKYPTNNLSIQLNYKNISERFSKEDIKKILIDIYKLQSIFYGLNVMDILERKSKKD